VSRFSVIFTLSCSIVLSGCGTIKAVSHDDRDTSGKFDGHWLGTFKRTPGVQYPVGGWELNCYNYEGGVVGLYIEKGIINVVNNDRTYSAFINEDGQFRIELPTEEVMTESIASDFALDQGQVTLILSGKLGKAQPTARFVVGVKEFDNDGCTTHLKLERSSGTAQET